MRYRSVCSPVLEMMAFNFSKQLKPVGEEIVGYRLYFLHLITRFHTRSLDYVITRELCCTAPSEAKKLVEQTSLPYPSVVFTTALTYTVNKTQLFNYVV